jgi:hypothetical protein
MPVRPHVRGRTGRRVADPDHFFVRGDGEGDPRTHDIVMPEQVVGDDGPRGMKDGDGAIQREPFIPLEGEKWRQSTREPRSAVRWSECSRNNNRKRRDVRARTASSGQTEPEKGGRAEARPQDDAPLCFRLFGGYYSSKGGPAPNTRAGANHFLEGQCASRARLRITQCKRSI